MILQPVEAKFKLELNGLWEVTILQPFDSKGRWKSIGEGDVVKVPMFYGTDLFYIYNVDKDSEEGVFINAKHIFFSLQKFYCKNINDTKNLYDVRPTSCTGQVALESILKGTRFSGKSDIATLNTAYYVRKNVVTAILGDDENSFLNRWGGEIWLNNYTVTINKRIGADYGVVCKYGINSTLIKETRNMENIITRAIPVMYNGLTLPEQYIDSPIINSYGEIYENVVEFSDIKVKENAEDEEGFDTEEQAFEECRKQVALLFEKEHIDKPEVTYEADMINKSNILKGIAKDGYIANLGDTITVIHDGLGIKLQTRVMTVEGDLLTGKYEKLTFSNVFTKPSGIVSNQNRVDNVLDKETGGVIAEKLGGFIDATKAKIIAQKGIAQKQHVRAMLFEDLDPNSPTYGAMTGGSQGVMISQQRTLDGREWDYTTALTAQGLVADKLFGNIFIGQNGYVDLLNGEFQLGGNSDDTVLITNKYGKWKKYDGTYTQIDADGLCNIDGNTKKPYFYMYDSGEVMVINKGGNFGDSQATIVEFTVQLNDKFKGKDFKFQCGISSIEPLVAPSIIGSQRYKILNIDKENARITIQVDVVVYGGRLHEGVYGETICAIQFEDENSNNGGADIIPPGGGGGTGGGHGDWRNGVPSGNHIRMLKGYEGFAPRTYSDSGGTRTIGYGTTASDASAWNELTSNQPVSEETAAKKMYDRIIAGYGKPIVSEIIQKFKVDSQQKFDALVDLAYNGGRGTLDLKHSLPKALSERPNDEAYIRPIWEKYWVSDGVKPQPGLVARRKAECDIYFHGKYEKRQIVKITSTGSYDGYVTENGGNGWLPNDVPGGQSEADKKRDAVVNSARKLIGKPYIWGGNYPPLGSSSGTDCSGLCQWAYNDSGIKITRTTYTQIKEGTRITDKNQLKPGDLIFTRFSSPGVPEHVFLYSGNGKVIEAKRTGTNILEHSNWQWQGEARRIIQDTREAEPINIEARKPAMQRTPVYKQAHIKVNWNVMA